MPNINDFYIHRYTKFIDACRVKNSVLEESTYTETHHILPQALFPKYKALRCHPWNAIKLTARQHFLAHWMLAKAYGGKMWAPLVVMKVDPIGRSILYEQSRIRWAKEMSGPNNPMRNPDIARKMSSKRLGITSEMQFELTGKHLSGYIAETVEAVCEECGTRKTIRNTKHRGKGNGRFCGKSCAAKDTNRKRWADPEYNLRVGKAISLSKIGKIPNWSPEGKAAVLAGMSAGRQRYRAAKMLYCQISH